MDPSERRPRSGGAPIRRWRTAWLVLLAGALVACGPAELTGASLVDALREGGYTLYLRHTETSAPGVDELATLSDCDAQRELSEDGRADAVAIGRALRLLEVPIGEVRSSPFCRVVETAELAFGAAVTDRALLSLATMELEGEAERDRVADAAAARLAEVPEPGTNRVLVGQFSNLRPVAGVALEEGATAVFRADGDTFELIAEIPPGGWPRLAAELADDG